MIRPPRRAAGPAGQGAITGQARPQDRGAGAAQVPVTTPTATRGEAECKKGLGQRWAVLSLLAAVIVVDQAVKWWAWRHVRGVMINPGGDFLTGPTIGSWYAHPVTGALLDVAGCGLVSIAAVLLARRRRRAAVTVCGSLMIGGWASNLLDRLGMHYWTAPGSIRGAVDFISAGGACWNVADVFIIGATPLFLLATARLTRRTADRPAASPARPAPGNAPRARVPAAAVAGAALIMTAALGAAHPGSLTKPAPTRTTKPPACAPNTHTGPAGHLSRASTPGPWTAAQPPRAHAATHHPPCTCSTQQQAASWAPCH